MVVDILPKLPEWGTIVNPQASQVQLFPNRRLAVVKGERPICTIVVDAEEDFDWMNPRRGVQMTTTNMLHTHTLQEIANAYGIRPTYLLTYPILEVPEIVKQLTYRMERGECDVGAQLHPWVTPPYDEYITDEHSFAGNLAPEFEYRKIMELKLKFTECFGKPPLMYRAGRYGLGDNSCAILESLGFRIDTSLAPRTDYRASGGPDYTDHGYRPFWFGGERNLLEIPLCRDIVGWAGTMAPPLYRKLSTSVFPALATAARLRCAERITLSPEGNDLKAMTRLVRRLYGAGERIFVVSLHSSSLTIGQNPYVQSKYDLRHLYDRLSGILDVMARDYATRFTGLLDIPAHLQAPA